MPLLSWDYGFFGDGSGNPCTFLAITARPYGAYWACVVDSKGPTPRMVNSLAKFIVGRGLVNFWYRSDKEAALKALVEDSIRESGRHVEPIDCSGRTIRPSDAPYPSKENVDDLQGDSPNAAPTELAVPEHSHAGESQSNGAAERYVQTVEDQSRNLKAALEDRLGWKIPFDHPIVHWIIYQSA